MEGSVKSLIEAEQEARAIVKQAEKQKNEQVKDAGTMASQILNKRRAELDAQFKAEEAKVSATSHYSSLLFLSLELIKDCYKY